MESVGYDMYCKLLEEVIKEIDEKMTKSSDTIKENINELRNM